MDTTALATQKAVLAVLAGQPLPDAAAQAALEAAELKAAVELFQQAGLAALEAQAAARTSWYQVHIQFPRWDTAEQTAVTHLRPWLHRAQADGLISSWWYIRKPPRWRLRVAPGATATRTSMKSALDHVLETLLSHHLITHWSPTIYEPETTVFGGPHAMDTAHRLFHADSSGILDYLARPDPARPQRPIGRRELTLLLCSLLMRSAGQEWSEQGEVWNEIAQIRSLPPDTAPDRLRDMQPAVRRLLTVDAGSTSTLLSASGPLAAFAPWAAAVEEAGTALCDAALTGRLDRGIRRILARHILFHLNRMGIPDTAQGILARAAYEAVITH